MKFTAPEEYGLRCILCLVRQEAQDAATVLTTSEIAAREGLSEQYVGKLFRILAKSGLVKSVRGRRGGYRLARPAAEIHVAETLAALGGKLYQPQLCERYTGNQVFCVHTNDCSIRSLWVGLQFLIDQVLCRTTLRDLVCSEKTMSAWMATLLASLGDLEGEAILAGQAGGMTPLPASEMRSLTGK